MKYFFDTEFIERGAGFPIDLISIGMVAEDGRELYLEHAGVDFDVASDWVKQNVYPHLQGAPAQYSLRTIAHSLTAFCDPAKYGRPELWAYYADYDWVVLCQLFGTMMDLPEGWPKWCRDIKQLGDDLGNPKLPEQDKGEHHALADARWNKEAWEFLRALPIEFYSACDPTQKPGGWQAGDTSWMFTFPLADGRTVRMHAGEEGRQSLRKIVLWEEIDNAADVAMEAL